MPSKAPTFNLLADYQAGPDHISLSPHWMVCVVRLGVPLSYSRKDRKSVSTDVSEGAKLRGNNLIIVSDCISLMVSGSKDSHLKSMTAELKQTDHNYLVEILPGDWILGWMMNDEESLLDLIDRVKKADPLNPCNKFDDGLKFVGRVDSVRKRAHLDRGTGLKTISVTVSAIGFRELDTELFYDPYMASNDFVEDKLGGWLANVGLDAGKLFEVNVQGGLKNNSRALITAFMDLLVGKGVGKRLNRVDTDVQKHGNQRFGSVRSGTGGGTLDNGSAPFAYLVPRAVGTMLGKSSSDISKPGGLMSYADLLDTLMGIQNYSSDQSNPDRPGDIFIPDLSEKDKNRMFTGKELLGTFLPLMPNFTNKPLWSLLQQFLNPTINEMYTCLRINPQGLVVPTLVVRQIPFTTEVFNPTSDQPEAGSVGPSGPTIEVTRFLSIPRWRLAAVMVNDLDIGRSDATRINFVHIYGQDSNTTEQVTFSQQLTNNPPIRDDFDIQRSGLRTYMTTVACTNKDQVGNTPSSWMALVADRVIGSQFTLNGTISSVGIRSPICEGDNLEFDGVVYHIESVVHHCSVGGAGERSWTTMLTLTNGLRSDGVTDTENQSPGDGGSGSTPAQFPIYPGLLPEDNRAYDPGISVDDAYDRTPPKTDKGDLADPNAKPGSNIQPDPVVGDVVTDGTKDVG